MSRRALTLAALFVLASATSAAVAQQARDPGAATPSTTATGSITGRVVDAEGVALRGAIVTLRADDAPLGRTVVTDDNGAFSFDALPAAHSRLSARKPAYLAMNFGAKHPEQSGTAIALTAGQRLEGVVIALPRGGVLSGTIVDALGVPMQGLNVFAARRDPARPDEPLTPAAPNATTDDRGAYRLYGLLPGEYAIGASTGQISASAAVVRGDEAVDAILRSLESRATGGDASQRTLAPAEHGKPPAPSAAFANLYYPGTPDSASAQLVRIAAGEERTGIDFTMEPTPTATVDGIVASPTGAGSPSLTLTPQGQQIKSTVGTLGPSARLSGPDADGRFIYAGLSPGHYTITAVWAAASQFASVDVDVNGRDISGLELSPQPALRVSGRVVVDVTGPPPALTNARLILAPRGYGGGLVLNGMQVGAVSVRIPNVDANGNFEFAGVVPAAYQIQNPTPLGKGLTMISAILNGHDLLDTPVEIRTDTSGLVVTFSDKHTELAGVLRSAGGTPVTGDVIVAMPVDRALWRATRRVVSTQPASDGAFTFADLPPGEYLLVAVSDVDSAELHDPELLNQLAPAGVKVTVGPGERVRQDLRVK